MPAQVPLEPISPSTPRRTPTSPSSWLNFSSAPSSKKQDCTRVRSSIPSRRRSFSPCSSRWKHEGITLVPQGVPDEVWRRTYSTNQHRQVSSLDQQASRSRPFNLNSPETTRRNPLRRNEARRESPRRRKPANSRPTNQTLASLAAATPHRGRASSNYREASKLKSTYVDALPNHRASSTPVASTPTLHQLVAATGRLASSPTPTSKTSPSAPPTGPRTPQSLRPPRRRVSPSSPPTTPRWNSASWPLMSGDRRR